MTRAHLAIARRPQAVTEASALMQAMAGHLSEQLAVPVSIEARLHDSTLQPLAHLAKTGVYAVLELNGDGLAVLELDMMSVGALLRHAAGASIAAAAPFRPTRIEEAALGWLLLSALSAVPTVAGALARYAPRLVSVDFDRSEVLGRVDARRKHLSVSLSLRVKDTAGTMRLILPSTWLQTVLESIPVEAPGLLHPSVSRAGLDATFIVGSMMLARRDAEQLGQGDVLVFPGVTIDGVGLRGPGRVVTPSFELAGTFTPQGLTLTRAIERPTLEPPMSNVDPSVPVEVEIELTRLRIPLDQLGVLKPGAVVPLHINAAQTVVLRVGDRAVARAELVEVEGEIGARILSML